MFTRAEVNDNTDNVSLRSHIWSETRNCLTTRGLMRSFHLCRTDWNFCSVTATLLATGFNQRAAYSHVLDLLSAAVIKAEHLKYVHHCSSIGKCSIAQKNALAEKGRHSHITLFPRRGAECVWALSKARKPAWSQRMSQRNKARRPIREAGNRGIYLYRHQNAVSWACWRTPPTAQQMEEGPECRRLLWLLWWGWRWSVWRQSRCK